MDSYPTPDPTQPLIIQESPYLRRSERNLLKDKKHLEYDKRYHPIDEVTKPAQARKRRRFHQLSSSSDSNHDENDDETSNEDNEDEEEEDFSPFRPSSNIVSASRRSPLGWRRSNRTRAQSPVYNENFHPQDPMLRQAGITNLCSKPPTRRKKRRKTTKKDTKSVENAHDDDDPNAQDPTIDLTRLSESERLVDVDSCISEQEQDQDYDESGHTAVSGTTYRMKDTAMSSSDLDRSSEAITQLQHQMENNIIFEPEIAPEEPEIISPTALDNEVSQNLTTASQSPISETEGSPPTTLKVLRDIDPNVRSKEPSQATSFSYSKQVRSKEENLIKPELSSDGVHDLRCPETT